MLTVSEAAKILRGSIQTVQFLIKQKILPAQRLRCYVRVPRETISAFSSKYLLSAAIATDLGSSAPYLVKLLKTESINPMPGTDVDGRPSCAVFNKNEIDKEYLLRLLVANRQVLRYGRALKTLQST